MTKTRDLADLGGGFIQTGTGAVQRTVEGKLQDTVSVKDFGAVGDGVTDDTAAFNAVIAYANAKGGTDRGNIIGSTIFIPEGRYRITSALNPITVSSVYLKGASSASSVLLCSSTAAVFTFGDSSLTNTVVGGGASDLKIEYPSGPSGAPIVFKIDYAFSLGFQNLMLENIGTFLSLGQSATRIAGGIVVQNVVGSIGNIGVSLFDLKWGAGLFISSCQVFVRGVTPPVHPASMTTVYGTHVFKMATGSWDTLQVVNCLFERFDQGVSALATAGMVYQTCHFSNVIFDYFRRWAVYAEAAGGILAGFKFDSACWFVSWETAALFFTRSTGSNDGHVVSGAVPIAGLQALSYDVNNGKTNIFTDLVVNGCNRLGTASGALQFQTGSTGFSVINVKGNGDASMAWTRPDYGIIVGANCDEYIVTSCVLQGPVLGYSFAANSSGSANRRAFNNISAGYAGYSAIAVPASGVTYTNTSPFVEEWNLFGGTITTGYDKNGQGFPGALDYVHFRLQPGDTFTVGYSASPSAKTFIEP